jgi:hypothetical protein
VIAAAPPRVDVEWLALRAGLKPVIRLTAEAGEVDVIAQRFRERGAEVVRALGAVGLARRLQAVVYIAFDRRRAEEAREIEAPILQPGGHLARDVEAGHVRALGACLGYPRCCVEVFAARLARTPLRRRAGAAAEAYLAARQAHVPCPNPWLNDLLFGLGVRVITFSPCRYDCREAGRVAAAVIDEVARHRRPAVRALEAWLRRPVVVGWFGARALADLDGDRRLVVRAAPPAAAGASADRADTMLAAGVVGARVGDDGTLMGGGGLAEPALLVDFASGA